MSSDYGGIDDSVYGRHDTYVVDAPSALMLPQESIILIRHGPDCCILLCSHDAGCRE